MGCDDARIRKVLCLAAQSLVPSYYSMFEQDKLFRSQGNLLLHIYYQGRLPAGSNEIKTPWINVAFEKIAEAISRSTDIEAVIVAPYWPDAKFYNDFDMIAMRGKVFKDRGQMCRLSVKLWNNRVENTILDIDR